jgi:hypothetical protein
MVLLQKVNTNDLGHKKNYDPCLLSYHHETRFGPEQDFITLTRANQGRDSSHYYVSLINKIHNMPITEVFLFSVLHPLIKGLVSRTF